MIVSVLGAALFGLIALLTLLVTLGAPLGEFTLGGAHKILPYRMRIASGISFLIQLLAIVSILQTGGHMKLLFPFPVTKGICIFFAVYLVINTVMNFFSDSKKEKYVMTPLSLIAAACFGITAFMN